jgi:peptidoglycan-associated lipoprotein
MQRKLWIVLFLVFVVPGLLLTASCAQKTVKPDQPVTDDQQEVIQATQAPEQSSQDDALARQRAEEERRRLEEEARLREERLRSERARLDAQRAEEEAMKMRMAERERFIAEDIYYAFDSSALPDEAQTVLRRKAQFIYANPQYNVITIEGHCDERGTNEYNLALGDRRAQSAKSFLVNMGVPSSRMITISYGEERPIAFGSTEEAWAKNRRSHFAIEPSVK